MSPTTADYGDTRVELGREGKPNEKQSEKMNADEKESTLDAGRTASHGSTRMIRSSMTCVLAQCMQQGSQMTKPCDTGIKIDCETRPLQLPSNQPSCVKTRASSLLMLTTQETFATSLRTRSGSRGAFSALSIQDARTCRHQLVLARVAYI